MNEAPPEGLSEEAEKIWNEVVQGWEMDTRSLTLLRVACEAFDDMEAAREEIRKHGLILEAPSKQRRKNPACEILKSARDNFLRAWQHLNLDVEPPKPIGRPGGGY
jgi:P27 family predicted phage terminase small subunit